MVVYSALKCSSYIITYNARVKSPVIDGEEDNILPNRIDFVFGEARRVLRGLVYRVAQYVILVLGGVAGDAVAQLRALLAEQRLPTKVATSFCIRVSYFHFGKKY